MLLGPTSMLSIMTPLTMKSSGLILVGSMLILFRKPYFGWVNVDTVQKPLEKSTQWGVSIPNTFPITRHLKSTNPALNVPRSHEPVAPDTVFSDTPAVDSGVK